MFKNSFNFVRRHGAKIVAGVSAAGTSLVTYAQAATPLETAAQTGIATAQTSGLTVGGYVVAAVAGLVVVGLVIAMVKKL